MYLTQGRLFYRPGPEGDYFFLMRKAWKLFFKLHCRTVHPKCPALGLGGCFQLYLNEDVDSPIIPISRYLLTPSGNCTRVYSLSKGTRLTWHLQVKKALIQFFSLMSLQRQKSRGDILIHSDCSEEHLSM